MIKNIINKRSIFFTITITFIVSLILIIISFTVLFKSGTQMERHFIKKRNIDVSKMILRETRHNGITKELKENLKEIDFALITDYKQQKRILKNKNIVITHISNSRRARVQYLKLNDKNLIFMHIKRDRILLIDNNKHRNNKYTLIAIFSVILFLFILLYITTLKKLIPLKDLKDKMKNLADEDFDIDCATTKQDEISQLANEFDKSAKKLKQLKESRNVFIRNIMHELKTPITKGKFLTQLPQTQENNETMQKVFYRLESLISEFTTIEELISTKKELIKKEYYLRDVIDNAIDILMCDENEVVEDFENIKVNIDFQLFSIAIKNLLDNGIKYSENKQVTIKTIDNQIEFHNIGTKLVYPLENYFEPFFKGDNVKSNQSFGLGLYIVKHILEANNYKIEYIYENNTNKFILSEK